MKKKKTGWHLYINKFYHGQLFYYESHDAWPYFANSFEGDGMEESFLRSM